MTGDLLFYSASLLLMNSGKRKRRRLIFLYFHLELNAFLRYLVRASAETGGRNEKTLTSAKFESKI